MRQRVKSKHILKFYWDIIRKVHGYVKYETVGTISPDIRREELPDNTYIRSSVKGKDAIWRVVWETHGLPHKTLKLLQLHDYSDVSNWYTVGLSLYDINSIYKYSHDENIEITKERLK